MHLEQLLIGLPEEPVFVPLHSRGREIFMPNEGMKILHHNFVDEVLNISASGEVSVYATAFQKGDSAVRNVWRHRNSRFFYLLDLERAFLNVNAERLAEILSKPDYLSSEDTKETFLDFLRRYFIAPQGGLVVGGPASPKLFNIYADRLLDRPLGSYALEKGCIYTRYADDLTTSSPKRLITKRMRREIQRIIESAGFKINHRKARFLDVRKGAVFINGVGVKNNGKLFLPRSYLRKLRGLIHRAATKKDVDPAVVHGMMGVFFAITNKCHFEKNTNATERRLISAYYKFRGYGFWGRLVS